MIKKFIMACGFLAISVPALLTAQVKLACVGNSITEAGGYVNFLGQRLGGGFTVRNYGLSGRTLLKQSDNTYWNEAKFAEMLNWRPEVVTVMLGTNDSKDFNWDGHAENFSADLQAFIDTLNQIIEPDPQIILALPPHAGEENFSIRGSIIHDEVIPRILEAAESNGLGTLDVNTPTLDKLHLMPDEVHPDNEGHLLMGDVFLEAIRNQVEGRTPPQKLLWYGNAPLYQGSQEADKPKLYMYPAAQPNETRSAVLICPGGGYTGLAMDHEGHQVAAWFNQRGISAYVLEYRFSPYRHPVPLEDVRRALKTLRYYADEWGHDPDNIGVLGFSAGGHLASSLGVHYEEGVADTLDPLEKVSSRPDFMVLVYPVITMESSFTHGGSRSALLGNNPSQQLVDEMSTYKQVDAQTPPAFIATGDADDVVSMQNSVVMDSALTAVGGSSTLFIDPGKGHGYGLDGLWPAELETWLGDHGAIPVGVGERAPGGTAPLQLQVDLTGERLLLHGSTGRMYDLRGQAVSR